MGKGAEKRKKQKAQRTYEHQVLPKIEAWEGRIIDPVARKNPSSRDDTRRRINARLQNPKGGSKKILDTCAAPRPNGYYVIVGRGAAAVINHTTLRQTDLGKKRLAGLPVMHIGLPDPWGLYHEHGMGQPPYLLRMPGYHHPVDLDPDDNTTIHKGCSSLLFSQSTAAEMKDLRERFETYITEAWVAAIESRTMKVSSDVKQQLIELGIPAGALETLLDLPFRDDAPPDPPYRLVVVTADGKPHLVYAHKIDICSGAGTMRVDTGTIAGDPVKAAKRKPWLHPAVWDDAIKNRLVVHGVDGLTEATPWDASQRICVYGGGGIGLNQVERAEDVEGVCLDWQARRTLHDTFNLRRNDTVLNHPTEDRRMEAGEGEAIRRGLNPDGTIDFNTTVPLVPYMEDWRLAKNSAVDGVTATGKKALVHITANTNAGIIDKYAPQTSIALDTNGCFIFSTPYAEANPSLAVGQFDRVILCNGQEQELPGEASAMAKPFKFDPIDFEGRLVGLNAEGGSIRVLGAAAAMFPKMNGTAQWKEMETYRLGLPASAVLPGFILAGVNIASANGWFAQSPNKNANTVSQSQLLSLLDGVPNAATIAATIVKLRRYPNNGFASIEKLGEALAGDTATQPLPENCATALEKLSTDYRPAAVWPA